MRTLLWFVVLVGFVAGIGCSSTSSPVDSYGDAGMDAETVVDSTGAPDALMPDAPGVDLWLPDGDLGDSSVPDATSDPDTDATSDTAAGADADSAGDIDADADIDVDADTVDVATDFDADPGADAEEGQGGEVVAQPFGETSGECGDIDSAELESPDHFLFTNHIDFADDPYDDADFDLLTPGGQEVILDGNAGGSSILSEAFSFEVLYWCEGAELLKTEMEIDYQDPQGTITDLLVLIDGHKVGVSVTRAVSWPKDAPYSDTQAQELLKKKLSGIQASTANVAPEDAWTKQILHVLAWSEAHAAVLEEVFNGLEPALKGDTILLVTVTDGDDAFLY